MKLSSILLATMISASIGAQAQEQDRKPKTDSTTNRALIKVEPVQLKDSAVVPTIRTKGIRRLKHPKRNSKSEYYCPPCGMG